MRETNRRTFLAGLGSALAAGGIAGQAGASGEPYDVVRDVVYQETPQGEYAADLYLPKRSDWNATVIYVHGGGWRGGDKARFERKARDMAARGYAGVSINYRLSGTARYPAAVKDVVAAVKWVRENAREYKFDEDRLALVGSSAGAHLAALVGVAGEYPRFQPDGFDPDTSTDVDGVVGFYGIYDLRPLEELGPDPAAVAFLGGTFDEVPERYVEASPAKYVSGDAPPHLLLHGTADERVPYRSSVAYERRLQAAGVDADLFTAPDARHVFDRTRKWYQPTFEALSEFLETTVPDRPGRRGPPPGVRD